MYVRSYMYRHWHCVLKSFCLRSDDWERNLIVLICLSIKSNSIDKPSLLFSFGLLIWDVNSFGQIDFERIFLFCRTTELFVVLTAIHWYPFIITVSFFIRFDLHLEKKSTRNRTAQLHRCSCENFISNFYSSVI